MAGEINFKIFILGLSFQLLNRPFFAHSQFDSKIIRFVLIVVTSLALTTGKMISVLGRSMERRNNLSIIF
jgi:hypothetical protein